MARIAGDYIARPGDRYAIVASRFNRSVTEALVEGAVDTLIRHGVDPDAIDVVNVPGAFEIPFAARRLVGRYQAILCLGAVVRGDTPHFDFVAGQTAAQIAALAASAPIPVIFGVLTCDTMEQARDRAGGKAGNKGVEAALAALEMVDLARRLTPPSTTGGD
jgi:6,7-dimethyl-8-ribityllumazine synthase